MESAVVAGDIAEDDGVIMELVELLIMGVSKVMGGFLVIGSETMSIVE